MKTKVLNIFLLLLIIILPFSINERNDDVEAQVLNKTTVGYYQSTTCEISLFEYLIKNRENDLNVYFNNNNYADINCFGKITGLDVVNETFIVSIGTNASINLLLQSCIWLFLILFIPKTKENKKINYRSALLLPFIFIVQFISENRFYKRSNILHSNELVFDNYYLISKFILFSLLIFLFVDIFTSRIDNILNYIPYLFLIIGTFSGMNLNFFIIIFCFFGLLNVFENRNFNLFDIIYSVFSLIWVFNVKENDYFFDGDKLRGFTNSEYNYLSQIFWIVAIYLLVKGLIFVIDESKNTFNLDLFKQNAIISSLLILFFGFIGSKSPILNFYNFYIFGQNKRGMKSFDSIAGNTWRGFSSSAESIGEFYAFTILLFFLIALKKGFFHRDVFFYLLIGAFYGLYRSNNFAATISIITILGILYLAKSKLFKDRKKYIYIGSLVLLMMGSLFYIQNKSYEFLSTELLYEATLHQDFYPSSDNYKSYLEVEKKMKERDLRTIILDETNKNNASTFYLYLVNVLTSGLNIPLFPNVIALVSAISLLINRTEMWGIFIAKHSPSLVETLFGVGPLQMNNYLSNHKVRLDVPSEKLQSLFLPHSSLLDLFIFTGVIGSLFIVGFLIYTIYQNIKINSPFTILLVFLSINFLKSDSALYLNSFILFLFCILATRRFNKEIKNE
tara:strand:- start:5958 stop:7985 length:2028 start_codon:yes stop_codon:yes gene_type:complete